MITNRVYRRFIPMLVAVLSWCIAHLLLEGTLYRYEASPYDFVMRNVSQQRTDPRILLVGIDDKTYEDKLFNRENHAQLLLNLKEHGAAAVFMDIVFDIDRDPDIDQALAEAVTENGRVVLATSLELSFVETEDRKTRVLGLAKLIDPLEKCIADGDALPGLINTFPDADNIVRRAALGLRSSDMPRPLPGPALATQAQLSGLRLSDLEFDRKTGRVIAPPLTIPTHHQDNTTEDELMGRELFTLPINFLPPATGPDASQNPHALTVVPYWALLDPDSPLLEQTRGAIVVVGDNSSKDTDVYPTPVGPMKGFEIHAQALNTVLTGPYQRPVPARLTGLVSFGFYLALAIGVMRARTKWSALAVALGLLGAQVALYVLAFTYGWQLQILSPLFGSLVAMTLALMARLVLTASVLERYVPPEVVSMMLSAGRTRPRTGVATVIVTDIRGYTTLSEGRTPREMLKLLNEYHSVTVAIYEKHGGRALTYQGDAQIIAFSKRGRNNPAANAIKAALDMQKAVDMLRVHWGLISKSDFDVGAAVCTGPVTIGEIGTTGTGRAEYTVIGQTVRQAHKIQSLSQEVGHTVLLDEETLARSTLSVHVEAFERTLEGSDRSVKIYGLRGISRQ